MKKQGFAPRFWQYLKERFPLHKNGVLLSIMYTALYFSGLAVAMTRFNTVTYFAGLVVFILFFLQLRLMDEFKDFKEDSKYRPERPVPRGLVTLAEIKPVLITVIILELAGGFIAGKEPLIFIAAAIAYSVLMFYEFFAANWLKKHIYVYALTHGVVSLPVAYFAALSASQDVMADWKLVFAGLAMFLSSFAYEIARKVRRKNEEQKGVETYTKASGETMPVFMLVFLCAAMLAAGLALSGAMTFHVKYLPAVRLFLSGISLLYAAGCLAYVSNRKKMNKGGFIEDITVAYVLLYYLTIIAAGFPAALQ